MKSINNKEVLKMSKIKTITTSTSGVDIVQIENAINNCCFLDSSEDTIALLYGDYNYEATEEGFSGMFENVHIFKGYLRESAHNQVFSFKYNTALKFFNMNKDLTYDVARMSDSPNKFVEAISGFDGAIDRFIVLKKDGMFIQDKSLFLPFHLKGLRRFKCCPNCKQYYRTYCKCTDKAQIRSHNMSRVYFNDVVNNTLVTSGTSLNKSLDRKRGFIGFEWELGYEKARRSQAEQTLGFYRMLKSKNIALLNLFGDAMSDATINQHYSKGAELGSNVFSLEYYKKYQIEIEEITEWANANEMYGSKLGFHIHISRDCFKQDTLVRWLSFMTTSNQVLLKLSGRGMSSRNQTSYARIALPFNYQVEKITSSQNGGMTTHKQIVKLAKAIMNGETFGDKFNYLNFQHQHSIEYRMPASATDDGSGVFNRVCRHLELMFASFEFAKTQELESMRFDKFLEWLGASDDFVNLYNAITSDNETMAMIEQSSKVSKAQTLIPPSTNIDVTNSEEVARMSEAFKEFEKVALTLNEEDEFTKEVITKHAGKLKPRKLKKGGA